jgi:hypothetical protein
VSKIAPRLTLPCSFFIFFSLLYFSIEKIHQEKTLGKSAITGKDFILQSKETLLNGR